MATIARVPAVSDRQRVSPEAIEGVVRQIAERFWPQRVILFGSYAYGQPQPESDVDLLVIMETNLREIEQAIRICQAVDYHFALDLIVRTPATMARRLALGDGFLHEIVEKGRVLYESPDGRVGR